MFICNKNIPLGAPSFDSIKKNTFYFKFETSLACSPEPVQCRIAGPKNIMYNLEPLIKTKGLKLYLVCCFLFLYRLPIAVIIRMECIVYLILG